MPPTRFPAVDGHRAGELRVDAHGIAFIPASLTLDDQLSMELSGWQLSWSQIDGIEPLARRSHARAWSRGAPRAGRRIRLHHDRCLRFRTLDIHAPLAELFAAVDSFAAPAAGAREAA